MKTGKRNEDNLLDGHKYATFDLKIQRNILASLIPWVEEKPHFCLVVHNVNSPDLGKQFVHMWMMGRISNTKSVCLTVRIDKNNLYHHDPWGGIVWITFGLQLVNHDKAIGFVWYMVEV